MKIQDMKEGKKEGNVLFNNALNRLDVVVWVLGLFLFCFCLWHLLLLLFLNFYFFKRLYDVRHRVKDHLDSEKRKHASD